MRKNEYTSEFRAEAVRIVESSSKSVPAVARDLGINSNTLHSWVRKAEQVSAGSGSGSLSVDERARLKQLERELREVRMERDFLKKAAAFFAKNQP